MIEKGVDLIVCQYSHCVGCEGKWQGDFMFEHSASALYGQKNKKLWFRIINKLLGCCFEKWYLSRQYDKQALLGIQNCVECEAHREMLETVLRNNATKRRVI